MIRNTKTRVSRLSGLFEVGVGKTGFGWRGLPIALFSHPEACPLKMVSDSEGPSMYTQGYRHRNLCHYHQTSTLCTGEAHDRNLPPILEHTKRGTTASSPHTSSFQAKCKGIWGCWCGGDGQGSILWKWSLITKGMMCVRDLGYLTPQLLSVIKRAGVCMIWRVPRTPHPKIYLL